MYRLLARLSRRAGRPTSTRWRRILCGVSRMVCSLAWIKEMDLNPVLAHPGGAVIADARVEIDPARRETPPRYGHMAIHPYPAELEGELTLRDGTRVPVRPIRPEDAGARAARSSRPLRALALSPLHAAPA